MTERLQLTIHYMNGFKRNVLVNYLHFEDGAIYFTEDEQCHNAVQMPIKVNLENVEWMLVNNVTCNGWKAVKA